MLKQIYLELIRSGVNPKNYTLPNDVEETDGQIDLDKNLYVQIGESYLILWQSVEGGEKMIQEAVVNKINNTTAVQQFINKVKSQLN
jgi:hypothetical protein